MIKIFDETVFLLLQKHYLTQNTVSSHMSKYLYKNVHNEKI